MVGVTDILRLGVGLGETEGCGLGVLVGVGVGDFETTGGAPVDGLTVIDGVTDGVGDGSGLPLQPDQSQ